MSLRDKMCPDIRMSDKNPSLRIIPKRKDTRLSSASRQLNDVLDAADLAEQ